MSAVQTAALEAFNLLANAYDEVFTHSSIGRAQRDVVWELLGEVFEPGSRILELNCGTGEDALFLAGRDIAVVACDGSGAMIDVARKRLQRENPDAPVHLLRLPTEHLWRLRPRASFDGVLSNFSGLNCVADLDQTARELARLTVPRAPMVLCLSTRFCLIEVVWYALHGNFRKALRRLSGKATATIGPYSVDVYYPTLRQLKRTFAPWFQLRAVQGVGVAVPPSYLEGVVSRWPRLVALLRRIDRLIARWPVARVAGDHMLLLFERRTTPTLKGLTLLRSETSC